MGGTAGLGAGGWRGQEAGCEAFYGIDGDAAIADAAGGQAGSAAPGRCRYFVGDDSRSTDVAYLPGLAFPTLRWFDGARGFVLPPAGEQALYVAPDRAAADFAKRCLGEGALLERERDAVLGAGVDLYLSGAGAGGCASPRR